VVTFCVGLALLSLIDTSGTCRKHKGQQGNCWFDLILILNQAYEPFSVYEPFQNENNIYEPIFDWFIKSVPKHEPFCI